MAPTDVVSHSHASQSYKGRAILPPPARVRPTASAPAGHNFIIRVTNFYEDRGLAARAGAGPKALPARQMLRIGRPRVVGRRRQ